MTQAGDAETVFKKLQQTDQSQEWQKHGEVLWHEHSVPEYVHSLRSVSVATP